MGNVCCKEEPVDLLSEGIHKKKYKERGFNWNFVKNSGTITFCTIKISW